MLERYKITQKWSPVIDSMFNDIKYMISYIKDDVAYQLELKSHKENNGKTTTSPLFPDSPVPKLGVFANNIKTYILETIPDYYIENVEVAVNPFNSEILFKHNGKFLNLKDVRKESITKYLKDIDFVNVINELYDKKPKVFVRKLKLEKLKQI